MSLKKACLPKNNALPYGYPTRILMMAGYCVTTWELFSPGKDMGLKVATSSIFTTQRGRKDFL